MEATARGRRVLGFFPHPDDESYAAGGTLALCAQAGARVQLLTATRGEAGPGRAPDLAGRREAELRRACAALGIDPPLFLDLPDGGADRWDRAEATRRLGQALRDLAPEVVLALGRDGAYGHRDHVACAEIVSAAVRALPEAIRPRLLFCAFPRGLWAPVYRRLCRFRRGALAATLDAATLGTDPDRVDLRVDVRPFIARKRAAMAAHRSQLRGGDVEDLFAPGIVRALLEQGEEWFLHAAGPPLPPGASHPLAT